MLTLLALVSPSHAANCGTPDAPSTYNTANCNSVCTYTNDAGPDTISCTLGASGTLYSAANYSLNAHDYSFWGLSAAGGTPFCCTFNETADEVDHIYLYGNASGAEHIYLHDGSASQVHYLHNPKLTSPTIGPAVAVYAWGGDDYIEGTKGTDIGQTFYGGDDDDDIYCFAETYVIAGDGDDYVVGSDEDDHIVGGAGSDAIAGHEGADILEAGPFGDPTDIDYLCGDAGADDMYGGVYYDYLWGGDDYDYILGGSGYETCAGDDVHSCDAVLGSRPSQCPAE